MRRKVARVASAPSLSLQPSTALLTASPSSPSSPTCPPRQAARPLRLAGGRLPALSPWRRGSRLLVLPVRGLPAGTEGRTGGGGGGGVYWGAARVIRRLLYKARGPAHTTWEPCEGRSRGICA